MRYGINFIIPVWGCEYTENLIKFCLPSLASKNNFGLFEKADGHRLIIATTKQYEETIKQSEIFLYLAQKIEIIFADISGIFKEITTSGAAHREYVNFRRMTAAHNIAISLTGQKEACSFIMPDNIFYDGFILNLLKYYRDTTSVLVYSPIVNLDKIERLTDEYLNGCVLDISNSNLCRIGINNLHFASQESFINEGSFLANGSIHYRTGKTSAIFRFSYLHPILVIPDGEMPLIPDMTIFDNGCFFKNAVGNGKMAISKQSDDLFMFSLDRETQKNDMAHLVMKNLNMLELAVRISSIEPEYRDNLKSRFLMNPESISHDDIYKFDCFIETLFAYIDLESLFRNYINFYRVKVNLLTTDNPAGFYADFIDKTANFKKMFLAKICPEHQKFYKSVFENLQQDDTVNYFSSDKLNMLLSIKRTLSAMGTPPDMKTDFDSIEVLNPHEIFSRLLELKSILSNGRVSFLYGAGDEASIYVSLLQNDADKIDSIIDDTKSISNKQIYGIRCISFDAFLCRKKESHQIIIMSPNYNDVIFDKIKYLANENCKIMKWERENGWQ